MPKLVNIGSMCVDHVYRVPNLAGAGETVASLGQQRFPGGKGLNQSLAAAAAGACVHHVGCVGPDGDWLRATLAEAGVDVSGVRTVDGPSGHALIQVDPQGRNAIVIAGGANRQLQDADVERALARVAPGDWLLLQNEINDVHRVLAAARQQAVALAFNVAPADGREREYDLAGVRLLIVNEVEAAALAAGGDPAAHEAAITQLAERLPETDVVLTRGAQGLLYRGPSGTGAIDAFEVTAVDETAAGDAFIGYLMAEVLNGSPLADALVAGAAAGALAVTRPGAASAIPTLDEVRRLLGR